MANREERIELGKKFIDVLKGFLSVSAKTTPEDIDDLVSKVPFGKIISFVYGLGRIYERIETPEEALHIAIVLGALRSFEETLVEFEFSKEQIEEILEELKADPEKEKRIQELAIPEKFSPDDLLNPDSEIYKSIKEIFLKPVKSYLFINNEDFAKRFRRKLKFNFWRVIEENENKFRFLLDKFRSESYKEAFRIYKIEKYRRKILNRFEEEAIFGNERGVALKDVYVEPEFRVYRECINEESKNLFKEDEEFFFEDERREKDNFLIFKDENERELHSFVYSILRGDYEKKEIFKAESPSVILLLGYPGGGKSSFCKKFIYDYCNNRTNLDRDVYLLELRRLSYKQELINSPLEVIKKELEELAGVGCNCDNGCGCH